MDPLTFPWELAVIIAAVVALLIIFTLVQWVFRPRPKRAPIKRLVFFLVCVGIIAYAFQAVPDFAAKLRAGVTTNSAFTSDTPQFPELQTPYFARDGASVFDAIEATARSEGWEITNRSPDQTSIRFEAGALVGIVDSQVTILIKPEGNRSRIEIQARNMSGGFDLGANRRIILTLLEGVANNLGVEIER